NLFPEAAGIYLDLHGFVFFDERAHLVYKLSDSLLPVEALLVEIDYGMMLIPSQDRDRVRVVIAQVNSHDGVPLTGERRQVDEMIQRLVVMKDQRLCIDFPF